MAGKVKDAAPAVVKEKEQSFADFEYIKDIEMASFATTTFLRLRHSLPPFKINLTL